jgi:hypothetical protein
MNLCGALVVAKEDGLRVPAERLSHPKDGALAQQPKAERAPDSAVVRPQAAGKLRSTSSVPIGRFVSCGAGGPVVAVGPSLTSDRGRNSAGMVGHFAFHCLAMVRLEHKECWFKPTRKRWFFRFLVQDRLRASDVLHRDWDWSGWL